MHFTREVFCKIIQDLDMGIDAESLQPDVPLSKQGIDSLDMINIIDAIEETYQLTLDTGTFQSGSWDTIDHIVHEVKRLLAEKD